MNENNQPTIIFNISGGNNQILPCAEKGEQHFHETDGSEIRQVGMASDASPESSAVSRFSIYVNKVGDSRRFLEQLSVCLSAAEVARTVVQMVMLKTGVRESDMGAKAFLSILVLLTPQITSGNTVDNYRKAISNAWFRRKE